jgi:hypothetical protein
MEKETEEKKSTSDNYDKEAYIRHLCEGLSGKGCGTTYEYICRHRRQKTWEEKCRDFQRHQGD